MCGIAGFLGITADPGKRHCAVQAMLDAMARRGPDAEGLETWPEAVLGHRRLAIFDLSEAGRQPMITSDRRLAVVFNGAIYNFRELRAQLAAEGAAFRSATDTEVLLHGYRAWGLDGLLARLRGMYAFCLWDATAGKAWLVRDRLGVKPLCYARRGTSLAFASTPRALARAGLTNGLRDDAVVRVLEYGFVPDSLSIYRGVEKLPVGCVLEWRLDEGVVEVRRYWQQPRMEPVSRSFDGAVDEAEHLLLQAVRRRLDADVPVAALLSGGIDSALVCWAIRHVGGDVQAFTLATPGDPGDESEDAKRAAAAIGLRHEVLPLGGPDVPSARDLAAAYPEPFPCSSAFGMLRLAQTIRERATVVLTGDGGDDVFLGYESHRHFFEAERLARRTPMFLACLWCAMREADAPRRGPARGLGRGLRFLDYVAGGLGAVQSAHDSRAYLGRLAGERLRDSSAWDSPARWDAARGRVLLQEYVDYALEHRFAGEYLVKVDHGAMWHALEARSPFLDQDLWEFAARLPADVRLEGGRLKAVLRALAARRIGGETAALRKRGFTVPAERWLVTAWREEFESRLADLRLARLGFLDEDALRAEWHRVRERELAPRQLWYVHAIETWLRYEEAA